MTSDALDTWQVICDVIEDVVLKSGTYFPNNNVTEAQRLEKNEL